MDWQYVVGLVALIWLIGSVVTMALDVRRGRVLCQELQERHSVLFDTLGRPCPAILPTSQSRQFAQFLASRRYNEVPDATLQSRFLSYHRQETQLLIALLVSLAIVAGLIAWVEFGR